MIGGVAAGHPATTEVGLRTLAAGGSAADAAVAAMLAACVAESILTGIGGGGFATYYDAATGEVTCLDFFCAVPGLDNDAKADPMMPIDVYFGPVPMSYRIGGASVAVPGVPAGAGEVHRRWGRLPWHRVVEPAVTLAASGALVSSSHALTLRAIAAAMLPGQGGEIYAPGGRLLQGGDRLHHPGLDRALGALAEEGPASYYRGAIGKLTVAAVRDAGGVLGPADLDAYRVAETPVTRAKIAGTTVLGRADLNRAIATVAGLPDLAGRPIGERAVGVTRTLLAHAHTPLPADPADPLADPRAREGIGDTTNISVVDRDGNACVITLTLGLGSGVWIPALGIHFNSMLGEGELRTGDAQPGDRMSSMMCPLVVLDDRGQLILAAGASGASRIRTALLATLVGTLVDGQDLATAIQAPRFHPVGTGGGTATVQVEPGYPAEAVTALAAAGHTVTTWDARADYFGAVSAVRPTGRPEAAGDPRRGGTGALLS